MPTPARRSTAVGAAYCPFAKLPTIRLLLCRMSAGSPSSCGCAKAPASHGDLRCTRNAVPPRGPYGVMPALAQQA
eukprot:217123-Pleurochrysis_carterae.AAC.1